MKNGQEAVFIGKGADHSWRLRIRKWTFHRHIFFNLLTKTWFFFCRHIFTTMYSWITYFFPKITIDVKFLDQTMIVIFSLFWRRACRGCKKKPQTKTALPSISTWVASGSDSFFFFFMCVYKHPEGKLLCWVLLLYLYTCWRKKLRQQLKKKKHNEVFLLEKTTMSRFW